MQARILEAQRGAQWVVQGWRVFRAAPFRWPAVVFLFMFFTQAVPLVPLIGLAALLLIPVFTVGLYSFARVAARGGAPEVRMLFSGFRSPLRPQLLLGGLYAAATLLVVLAVRFADSEGVLQAVIAGARKDPEAATQLIPVLALFALAYMPVSMMFWFAPLLVAWHSTSVPKAIFFSFAACVLNWRAVLGYVGTLALPVLALLLVAYILGLAHGAAAPESSALPYLFLGFFAVGIPVLYGSFYATYEDVFGAA